MSDPGWWGERAAKKRQNRRSAAQERSVARAEGGRIQAGSGSSRRAPQDVKSDDSLSQVKYTDAQGYRLTASEWEHVRRDALRHGREAAMIIEFTRTGRRLKITEVDT